jgi:hypothetical protein
MGAALSAILAVLFSVVLAKNLMSLQFKFITSISGLLILSNLAFIFCAKGDGEIFRRENNPQAGVDLWIDFLGVFSTLRDASFNVATWIFAFEYYKIGRMMPLALKGMTMPRGMITYNMVTNIVFLALNCVLPVVEGILITISNYKYFKPEPYKKTFEASIIAKVSVGVL